MSERHVDCPCTGGPWHGQAYRAAVNPETELPEQFFQLTHGGVCYHYEANEYGVFVMVEAFDGSTHQLMEFYGGPWCGRREVKRKDIDTIIVSYQPEGEYAAWDDGEFVWVPEFMGEDE